jgi:hypothetical protein
MALGQLGPGTRVTTPIDQIVRVYERRSVEVDFGVVNFARLIGTVYNDYAMNGTRQADAPGVPNVTLIVAGAGGERRIVTDAAGDIEIEDIVPGRYLVSIDASTVPPNYVAADSPVVIDIAPSTTATVALPAQALRSIGGRVFVRDAARLRPIKGVRVSAPGLLAVTDESGQFLLRGLPAGDLEIVLPPVAPLPDDLRAPSGRVRMPKTPVEIEDATIVIDNPRLVPFLVPEPAAVVSAAVQR